MPLHILIFRRLIRHGRHDAQLVIAKQNAAPVLAIIAFADAGIIPRAVGKIVGLDRFVAPIGGPHLLARAAKADSVPAETEVVARKLQQNKAAGDLAG